MLSACGHKGQTNGGTDGEWNATVIITFKYKAFKCYHSVYVRRSVTSTII